MIVEIVGTNPPGRNCAGYDNIHVGLGLKAEPHYLFRGDAKNAKWKVEVNVIDGDFRGRFVHGKKGERFLYLNWGDVDGKGAFELFRRAKIILNDVDPKLIATAETNATALVARVNLTDEKGNPTCARLKPPSIAWSVA